MLIDKGKQRPIDNGPVRNPSCCKHAAKSFVLAFIHELKIRPVHRPAFEKARLDRSLRDERVLIVSRILRDVCEKGLDGRLGSLQHLREVARVVHEQPRDTVFLVPYSRASQQVCKLAIRHAMTRTRKIHDPNQILAHLNSTSCRGSVRDSRRRPAPLHCGRPVRSPVV